MRSQRGSPRGHKDSKYFTLVPSPQLGANLGNSLLLYSIKDRSSAGLKARTGAFP